MSRGSPPSSTSCAARTTSFSTQPFETEPSMLPSSRRMSFDPTGRGAGKAAAGLARRGYSVTGVGLWPDLAAVARRNVPEARIEVGDFETWEPEEADFDAVTAFAAFHWIAPALRYTKPARLLRPG